MTAPFKAECPHCFTTFNLKNRSSAGKKVKCKSCGEPFVVKLIGASGPSDEFDDDVEDYGDVEDYDDLPSSAALPPASSSRRKPAGKKKRKKGGSSVPKTPFIIALIVVVVAAGGWFVFTSLPAGGLFTMFDSPEGLLDKYIDTQYAIMDTLASVKSADDMEWLKGKIDGYRDRIKDLNKRLLLLGPISEERAKEVRKYTVELSDLHQEKLRERSKATLERLRNANLIQADFQEAISGLMGTRFSMQYIFPTPEPRERFPVEQYLAEQDELSRDTAKVLIQVDDLSSAKSQINKVKELTARYRALKDHENLGAAPPGSPYFSRRISWSSFVGSLEREAGEFAQQNPDVKQVYDDLSTAMHDLTFAEHESRFQRPMGGPRGRPPGFDPARPGGGNPRPGAG